MSEREYSRRKIVDYSNRKKSDIERPFEDIADRLNEWKKTSGIFNKELSSNSGVSEAAIAKVFQGTRFPDHRLLTYLHKEHGIDLNWLICGDQG